jgi:hypothetical protein
MWKPGEHGGHRIREHIQAVKDCATYGVRRMVIYMTNDDSPPDISEKLTSTEAHGLSFGSGKKIEGPEFYSFKNEKAV